MFPPSVFCAHCSCCAVFCSLILPLRRFNNNDCDECSIAFLRWACNVPGFHPEWIVGIRNAKANKEGKHKLMACITGIPQMMGVRGVDIPMAEINFLCVHKKLRAKRLAPVLIKEVGSWHVDSIHVALPHRFCNRAHACYCFCCFVDAFIACQRQHAYPQTVLVGLRR